MKGTCLTWPLTLFIAAVLLCLTGGMASGSSRPYITSHGINFGSGNKYQVETDFTITTPAGPLTLTRTYNSQGGEDGVMGHGWTMSFGERLVIATDRIILVEAGGRHVHFREDGNSWTSETGKVRTITRTEAGYRLAEPDGAVKLYDAAGVILSGHKPNNITLTYAYDGPLLASVADSFGNTLSFAYTGSRLTALISPAGTFGYAYDADGNLVSVARPDGTTRRYLYGDPHDGHNLTGIIDEAGSRILTVTYDDNDRVTGAAGAEGLDQYTIEYLPDGQRRITDSLGASTTYKLETMYGIIRVQSFTGPGCSACGADTGSSYAYTSRQQVEQVTDARGTVTVYRYDALGNRISRTEAAGTPEERTTSWTYDPVGNRIAAVTRDSVSHPGGQSGVRMSYDAGGNLLARTQSGYAGVEPVSRTTSYTWDSLGRLTSVDGPRTDVHDTTSFTYYPDTPDQGRDRGFLRSVTNALGHATTYSQYNAFGRPELITTPNGTEIALAYDAAGRLRSEDHAGVIREYTYDPTGRLTRIDLPEDRFIAYLYDAGGRMVAVTDNMGNSVTYAYDAGGNRTKEEIRDPDGVLRRLVQYTYEQTGALDMTILADGGTEDLDYDAVGNLVRRVNGEGSVTGYAYDALNRLTALTEPGDAVTGYVWDADDHVTGVTDAEGHATTFAYDDFGRRIARLSPDTGRTIYSYDEADNPLTRTDARGITVRYEYDALNRIAAERYADPALDVTYAYDLGENGIGRLSRIQDATGETSYLYDPLGRVVVAKRTMAGLSFRIDYWYNRNSELTAMVYPGGRIIGYQRDGAGRIVAVTSTYGGVTETLARDASYLPFGPLTTMTLGNGLEVSNSYDRAYRLTDAVAGTVYDRGYLYTAGGLVGSITDHVSPGLSQDFVYDELHRLTEAQGSYGTLSYAYDKVGNRLRQTGTTVEEYVYLDGTNRLAEVSGDRSVGYGYDEAGNIIVRGEDLFSYDPANRLAAVSRSEDTVAEYGYDGNGLRTVRTKQGRTVYFLYDLDGSLLGEYNAGGRVIREYVYADGRPLALLAYRHAGGTGRGNDGVPPGMGNRPEGRDTPPGQEQTPPGREHKGELPASLPNLPPEVMDRALPTYRPLTCYFINDHLGTPQLLVDDQAVVVWQGEYRPFGEVELTVNRVENTLRFPGQYVDAETGLYYNWHRYYDPETGRYLTPDPIGLDGGTNLYVYVGENPVNAVDPRGLDNPGCDRFPDRWESPCVLECCASHDECYDRNACGADSWYNCNAVGPNGECRNECNENVADCIAQCALDRRHEDPNRPDYYCPRQHRYVRIPGDFPDMQSARQACSTDAPPTPPQPFDLPLSP